MHCIKRTDRVHRLHAFLITHITPMQFKRATRFKPFHLFFHTVFRTIHKGRAKQIHGATQSKRTDAFISPRRFAHQCTASLRQLHILQECKGTSRSPPHQRTDEPTQHYTKAFKRNETRVWHTAAKETATKLHRTLLDVSRFEISGDFQIVTHAATHKYPRTAVFTTKSSENGSTGVLGQARMCHNPKLRPFLRIVTHFPASRHLSPLTQPTKPTQDTAAPRIPRKHHLAASYRNADKSGAYTKDSGIRSGLRNMVIYNGR